MRVQFILTNEIKKANIIIGLKKHIKQNKKLKKTIKNHTVYSLNKITFFEIKNLLNDIMKYIILEKNIKNYSF